MAKSSQTRRRSAVSGNDPPKDWGVPDWRDASAYPRDLLTIVSPNLVPSIFNDCELVRRALRRWELLRRAPEYRRDWERLKNGVVEGSSKYGLVVGFPDPRQSRPWPLLFDEMIGIDPGIVLAGQYTFDLSRRLNPQFRHAQQIMRRAQEHLRSQEVFKSFLVRLSERERLANDLPRILRALDARDANATFAHIARVIIHKGRAGPNSPTALGSLGKKLHNRAVELQRALAPIHHDRPVDRYADNPGTLTGMYSVIIRGQAPPHEAEDEKTS